MDELREMFAFIVNMIRQPDFIMLGGLFVIFVIGFTCGVLAYEIHAIKHQIKMHQYHSRRRDK